MKKIALLSAAALLISALTTIAQEAPIQVAYYYKVRWGFQQEFERLFLKNHYPLLQAQKKDGRIRGVSLYKPTFHGEGRADWTFLVVIEFASFTALGSPSNEEALARRLFPDQDAFKKEEQRRFEILDAHWDVPLTEVESPAP